MVEVIHSGVRAKFTFNVCADGQFSMDKRPFKCLVCEMSVCVLLKKKKKIFWMVLYKVVKA